MAGRAEKRKAAELKRSELRVKILDILDEEFTRTKDLKRASLAVDKYISKLCRERPQEKELYFACVREVGATLSERFKQAAQAALEGEDVEKDNGQA